VNQFRSLVISTHYSIVNRDSGLCQDFTKEPLLIFKYNQVGTPLLLTQRTPSQCHNSTILHAVMSLLIPTNLCVTKVLHSDPSHHNPNPSHNRSQYDQSRVISHDGQRRVIFKLWRCIGCLANIPSPTPYF
jgi:hypothetical protein